MNLKDQTLRKLHLERWSPMQEEAHLAIEHSADVLLLSPTGSGKTLAFLMPVIERLSISKGGVQALVIAPSRELAMQIESVARNMATGFKVNVVYGGRTIKKDFQDLATLPALLIGTPGRVGDHLRRGTIEGSTIKTLVLDEYDKSLELGFEDEMSELYDHLRHLEHRILTSATQGVVIPNWFLGYKPLVVNYLHEKLNNLTIKRIVSEDKDKLVRLEEALLSMSGKRGIIFHNFKDSIQRTSDFLTSRNIAHGVFYGGMDQHDRERALVQFRNGTNNIILATDLAARGIDVPEIDFIMHYHLPFKAEEFVHRNGRTARMHQDGVAYVLHWRGDVLPGFIPKSPEHKITVSEGVTERQWATLFISGGRQDKISKGDVAGFCIKIGELEEDEVGMITLNQDCAFVAIPKAKVHIVISALNNQKLKKRKVRVYEVV